MPKPIDIAAVTGSLYEAIEDREELNKRLEALEKEHNLTIRCGLDFWVFTWGATVVVKIKTHNERMEFFGMPSLRLLVRHLEAWVKTDMKKFLYDSERMHRG